MAEHAGKPKVRFAGFTETWEQRKFEKIAIRSSAMAVCSRSLPGVEYEDIISEQGILNKDIKTKRAVKIGIKFLPGDVLFGKLRPYLKNWLLPDFTGVAVGDFWVLQPSEIDSQYLYYLIQTPAFQEVSNQSTGTKMPRADWNLVANSMFFLPQNDDEQTCIGTFFRQLDRLITLHQRKRGRLENIKKAMLEKMFPKNGADVPEVRFVGFTEAWEQRKLGELGSVAMCKRIFKDQTSEEGDVPFYKIGTFGEEPNAYISRELFDEYKSKYPYPDKGTILISASGSIGRIVEFTGKDEYFQDSNIVWLKHDKRIADTFLKYIYEVISWAGIEGSTIKRLYNDNILKTEVKLPCIDEQEHIGRFFRHLDRLVTLHQRKVALLQNIKKACLEKMFV